ncbi:MAG TPA: bifunctional methylenetetrahydrofolate dehydrogenase/methenyltetrahydrofolate cyclohydrolase FolD [Alphaproteobacteria bacterium]|jgi:methylenetetrahydrofolate dehydrogenase (NADP+)/methenyltetrahydrofolate cyclohydrolase|nr:bifunctional methylenetetrahydrofolate dehydrogenase/methenyltetrahydrofolate cyclohydrolase FolD [Alphaproteobacteria bacterium]HJM48778.1 bifunctional methylenetetrahydrofolate dehydrogenase/methenyltetrahydrofolate cyclohydrolase FolD [Alphaproteobacteria bacterium]|tara:strand:- start:392 stop:1294 length:903 start_codon:yes stop_codon:yes gene_type:complete
MNDTAAATATVIDGKAFAAGLRQRIGAAVAEVKASHGLTPGLAVVLLGQDPASEVYTRNKAKQTVEAGMNSFKFDLPAETTEAELLARVAELNADASVHGILVQLPLPDQIDEHAVVNAIDPAKDVDGFHVINTGRLATGQDAMVPCTPRGCLMLLHDTLGELKGLRALVLGRSNIVGKPMAALLLAQHCTVTMAHSRTRDLAQECRRADILVAAVGQPEMVRGDWIKPGATVIDVGVNRIDAGEGKTRLVGDVAYAEAAQVAGAITPVPGGVGPMTIAVLLSNTLIAACRQHGVAVPEV